MLTRALAYTQIVTGLILLVTGVALILAYIVEAIIARLGEPDQSLLFWYIPLLLFGILAVTIAFRLLSRGRKSLDTDSNHR